MIGSPWTTDTVLLADYQFSQDSRAFLRQRTCSIEDELKLSSPLGPEVTILRVRAIDKPSEMFLAQRRYVRILDCCYLPTPPDPVIDTALCDHIALNYDRLVETRRNIETIRKLMSIVFNYWPDVEKHLKVLDFGCGTGLSVIAVQQLPAHDVARLRLTGFDTSNSMLAQARARGLHTLDMSDWLQTRAATFDAVFASYVLHFGLTDLEVATLAKQLRPRGIFVGNCHKGASEQLCILRSQFVNAGFSQEEPGVGDATDPVLKFVLRP